jgi:hypothetical protein
MVSNVRKKLRINARMAKNGEEEPDVISSRRLEETAVVVV